MTGDKVDTEEIIAIKSILIRIKLNLDVLALYLGTPGTIREPYIFRQ